VHSATFTGAWLFFPILLLLCLYRPLEVFPGVLYFFRHKPMRFAHVRVPNAEYLGARCRLHRRTVSSTACAHLLLLGLWPSVKTSATAHGLSQVLQVTLTTGLPFSSTVDSSSSPSEDEEELLAESPHPEASPDDG